MVQDRRIIFPYIVQDRMRIFPYIVQESMRIYSYIVKDIRIIRIIYLSTRNK